MRGAPCCSLCELWPAQAMQLGGRTSRWHARAGTHACPCTRACTYTQACTYLGPCGQMRARIIGTTVRAHTHVHPHRGISPAPTQGHIPCTHTYACPTHIRGRAARVSLTHSCARTHMYMLPQVSSAAACSTYAHACLHTCTHMYMPPQVCSAAACLYTCTHMYMLPQLCSAAVCLHTCTHMYMRPQVCSAAA